MATPSTGQFNPTLTAGVDVVELGAVAEAPVVSDSGDKAIVGDCSFPYVASGCVIVAAGSAVVVSGGVIVAAAGSVVVAPGTVVVVAGGLVVVSVGDGGDGGGGIEPPLLDTPEITRIEAPVQVACIS